MSLMPIFVRLSMLWIPLRHRGVRALPAINTIRLFDPSGKNEVGLPNKLDVTATGQSCLLRAMITSLTM